MKRSLTLLLALCGAMPVPLRAADQPPRPNIIFVLVDDLGWGDIGVFYQNQRRAAHDPALPWHTTPHLDTMAAEGLQLPNHYCSAPVCAPARAM